jgi:hypothetical protein
LINSTVRNCVFALLLFIGPLASAAPLEIRLRHLTVNGASRPADSNFRLAGNFGYSIASRGGLYFLWGATAVHRRAWNSSGTDMHDLQVWWPAGSPCDPTWQSFPTSDSPTDNRRRCGDGSSMWFTANGSTSGTWWYNGATTAHQVDGFARPTTWPQVYNGSASQLGLPDGEPFATAAKLNGKVASNRPLPANTYRNTAGYATGTANAKATKITGSETWFVALNKTIHTTNPVYGSNGTDTFRIVWAEVSSDGRTIDYATELFFDSREDVAGNAALIAEQLFVDNGYFYLLTQRVGDPFVLLLRAPTTTNAARSWTNWEALTSDPYDPWKQPPSQLLNPDATYYDGTTGQWWQLRRVLNSGASGGIKQASIARVFNSSAANAQSRYIAIANDQKVGTQGTNNLELWVTSDLSQDFVRHQSNVRTDRLLGADPATPTQLPPLAEFGWEFSFTGFDDNTPSTPRIIGHEFDLWLNGVYDGRGNNTPDGQTWRNVVYRATATLSGDIFSPRVALKTANNTNYVRAIYGGGPNAWLDAGATAVGDWETLTVVDHNGGTLQHGDQVSLQVINAYFITAYLGGGSTALLNGNHRDAWETFTIERVVDNYPYGTTIGEGDKVAFRSYNGNNYLFAQNGGNGNVDVTGTSNTQANAQFVFDEQ